MKPGFPLVPFEEIGEDGWEQGCREIFARCGIVPEEPPVVNEAEMKAAEERLGCALPSALHCFYREFGLLEVNESFLAPEEMTRLPEWMERQEAEPDSAEAEMAARLVVIAGREDSAAACCLHEQDGSVWFYDEALSPALTPLFSCASDYIKASLILMQEDCSGVVEDTVEAMLEECFGEASIVKWLY